MDYEKQFKTTEFTIKSNIDAVSHATCAMAIDVNARCIIVNSLTGKTARMVRTLQPGIILNNRLECSGEGFGSLAQGRPAAYCLSDDGMPLNGQTSRL